MTREEKIKTYTNELRRWHLNRGISGVHASPEPRPQDCGLCDETDLWQARNTKAKVETDLKREGKI